LNELNTLTSYNHNAKYHALPDIPQFDEYGIWRYKGIGFSRHGNLTRTVRYLADHSPEGITAQQICAILGVSAASLYTFFRNIPGIAAHRDGRALIFFSAQAESRTLQIARRCESNVPLRSADAVLVLVDRIKHPEDTIEQCVRRLRRQSAAITPQAVRLLLERHGIVKKLRRSPDCSSETTPA
jgi:AcrR family transcriptional regulator